jgi:hypothetical protein
MWLCPVVPDIKYHRFPCSLIWWCLPDTESPQTSLGMSRSGLIGGEILPVQDYQDRGTYWCRLLLVLVLLGWWFLLFSQKWWDHIRYKCMVKQSFIAGGTDCIHIF